tara:strand:- start:151 stop:291 length:141 start_codon:yes stop_codon:yes gene_type:complete
VDLPKNRARILRSDGVPQILAKISGNFPEPGIKRFHLVNLADDFHG